MESQHEPFGPDAEQEEEDDPEPGVDDLEQRHDVWQLEVRVPHVGLGPEESPAPEKDEEGRGDQVALDLVPEVQDGVLVVALDAHHVEHDDGDVAEGDEEAEGVEDEEDPDDRLLPADED